MRFLLYLYARKEALVSSQIEGAQSSFADLLFENEADSLNRKKMRGRLDAGLAVLSEFPLVHSNVSIQQVTAVAVAIVQRDAEQARRRQRTVGSDNGERNRMPIVGPSAGEGHSVPNFVEGCGRDVRRLKIDAGAGIAIGGASSGLVGIVIIEAELRLAAVLAVLVAIAATFVRGSGALAFGRDAGGCRLLPREVRDGGTGMIVRKGNVDEMVRVNADLEEVGEAAVRGARQAPG